MNIEKVRHKGLKRLYENDDASGLPANPAPRGGERLVKEQQPAGAWSAHGMKLPNQTHRSQSDPEARLYCKGDLSSTRLSYLTHDLIDTKSRVILRRRVSQVAGSAEHEVALQMLDEVLKVRTELGLPKVPEILTADTGYGSAEFVADVLERGITPHVPLLWANETPASAISAEPLIWFGLASGKRRVGWPSHVSSCGRCTRRLDTR